MAEPTAIPFVLSERYTLMAEYITHSRAETVALGKRMAAVLQPGALIAFTGGLGAG